MVRRFWACSDAASSPASPGGGGRSRGADPAAFDPDALPDMPERFASRIQVALADEAEVRLGPLPAHEAP